VYPGTLTNRPQTQSAADLHCINKLHTFTTLPNEFLLNASDNRKYNTAENTKTLNDFNNNGVGGSMMVCVASFVFTKKVLVLNVSG
jgi:hypothetical protein